MSGASSRVSGSRCRVTTTPRRRRTCNPSRGAPFVAALGAPFCRARSSCLLSSWTTRDRLDRLVARRRQRGRRLGGAAHDARAPQPGDDDDDATLLLSLSRLVAFWPAPSQNRLLLWLASSRNRLRVARAPPLGLRERKEGAFHARRVRFRLHVPSRLPPTREREPAIDVAINRDDDHRERRPLECVSRIGRRRSMPRPASPPSSAAAGTDGRRGLGLSFVPPRAVSGVVGRSASFVLLRRRLGLVAPFRFGSDLGSVADSSTGSSPR